TQTPRHPRAPHSFPTRRSSDLVTPHGDQLELSVEQAGGFTTALHAFVEDCLSRPDCPLADGDDATVADGVARIAELLERAAAERSEEHTSELQSRENLVCRLLL